MLHMVKIRPLGLWLPRQFFSTRSHIIFGSSGGYDLSGIHMESHGKTTANHQPVAGKKRRNLRTLFFKWVLFFIVPSGIITMGLSEELNAPKSTGWFWFSDSPQGVKFWSPILRANLDIVGGYNPIICPLITSIQNNLVL